MLLSSSETMGFITKKNFNRHESLGHIRQYAQQIHPDHPNALKTQDGLVYKKVDDLEEFKLLTALSSEDTDRFQKAGLPVPSQDLPKAMYKDPNGALLHAEFVIPYIEGVPLEKSLPLSENKEELDHALEGLLNILEQMEFMSFELWTHRDIKPGNIIITPSGKWRLIDFDIADKAGMAYIDRDKKPRYGIQKHGEYVSGTPLYIAIDHVDPSAKGSIHGDLESWALTAIEAISAFQRDGGNSDTLLGLNDQKLINKFNKHIEKTSALHKLTPNQKKALGLFTSLLEELVCFKVETNKAEQNKFNERISISEVLDRYRKILALYFGDKKYLTKRINYSKKDIEYIKNNIKDEFPDYLCKQVSISKLWYPNKLGDKPDPNQIDHNNLGLNNDGLFRLYMHKLTESIVLEKDKLYKAFPHQEQRSIIEQEIQAIKGLYSNKKLTIKSAKQYCNHIKAYSQMRKLEARLMSYGLEDFSLAKDISIEAILESIQELRQLSQKSIQGFKNSSSEQRSYKTQETIYDWETYKINRELEKITKAKEFYEKSKDNQVFDFKEKILTNKLRAERINKVLSIEQEIHEIVKIFNDKDYGSELSSSDLSNLKQLANKYEELFKEWRYSRIGLPEEIRTRVYQQIDLMGIIFKNITEKFTHPSRIKNCRTLTPLLNKIHSLRHLSLLVNKSSRFPLELD